MLQLNLLMARIDKELQTEVLLQVLNMLLDNYVSNQNCGFYCKLASISFTSRN